MSADHAGIQLELAHSAARRTRLRPARPRSPEDLRAIAERIAAVPGVVRVISRPTTGSLIVETHVAADKVLDRIEADGIARITRPAAPPPISQIAQFGMLRADMAVKASTDDVLDLNSAVALLLTMGAIIQLSRGRIAGPATTLLAAALSMMDRSSGSGAR